MVSCPWLVAIAPSPALIVPLPVNSFPNKPAPKVPNKIARNPPFCSFASFLSVSVTSFRFNFVHDIIHFFIQNY